ncbi:MAG: hypothetical protein ACE5EC_06005 [Phycisphaerae bacterium]
MRSMRQKACVVMVSLAVIGMTGCFGESILTAAAKVAGGQISELTANEILILNQTASDLIGATDPNAQVPALTEAQASAVSDFLKANNLNTLEDFDALQQAAQTDPSSIQGLDALSAAFSGSTNEIDPNNLDPNSIDSILGPLFGQTGGMQ